MGSCDGGSGSACNEQRRRRRRSGEDMRREFQISEPIAWTGLRKKGVGMAPYTVPVGAGSVGHELLYVQVP
jgi:hypothetical protein